MPAAKWPTSSASSEEQHAADQREQREGDDAAMRISLAAAAEAGNH
jgi:hypothetical protein